MAPDVDVARVAVFNLDKKENAAVAAFLKDGLIGAGSPAPTYSARVALRRFGCLNCHSRDGEGGIPSDLADQMRLLEKAENADDVRPPLLTGIGHKARRSWLKSVLTGGGRARPWMLKRARVSVVRYAHTNAAATVSVEATTQATSQFPGVAEPGTRHPIATARAARTSVAASRRVAMCRDMRTDGSTKRRSSTYSAIADWVNRERCTRTVR